MIKLKGVRLPETHRIKIGCFGKTYEKDGVVRRMPQKWDHFKICKNVKESLPGIPENYQNHIVDDAITAMLACDGEDQKKPKRIGPCFLPFDTIEANMFTSYSYYGSKNWKCRGDGITAEERIEKQGRDEFKTINCIPSMCPHYQEKRCRVQAVLSLILPQIPFGGVAVYRTKSRNAVEAILSQMILYLSQRGSLAGVPFNLVLNDKRCMDSTGTMRNIKFVSLEFSGTYDEFMHLPKREAPQMLDLSVEVVRNQRMLMDRASKILENAEEFEDGHEEEEPKPAIEPDISGDGSKDMPGEGVSETSSDQEGYEVKPEESDPVPDEESETVKKICQICEKTIRKNGRVYNVNGADCCKTCYTDNQAPIYDPADTENNFCGKQYPQDNALINLEDEEDFQIIGDAILDKEWTINRDDAKDIIDAVNKNIRSMGRKKVNKKLEKYGVYCTNLFDLERAAAVKFFKAAFDRDLGPHTYKQPEADTPEKAEERKANLKKQKEDLVNEIVKNIEQFIFITNPGAGPAEVTTTTLVELCRVSGVMSLNKPEDLMCLTTDKLSLVNAKAVRELEEEKTRKEKEAEKAADQEDQPSDDDVTVDDDNKF